MLKIQDSLKIPKTVDMDPESHQEDVDSNDTPCEQLKFLLKEKEVQVESFMLQVMKVMFVLFPVVKVGIFQTAHQPLTSSSFCNGLA